MSQPQASSTEILLRQAYALARGHLDTPLSIAVLHLGSLQSGLALGAGQEPHTVQTFDLGLERLASTYFKTTPPTALAMERAIMVVEDVVMPLHALIPRPAQLLSCDGVLRALALVSGATAAHDAGGTLVLSLEALERTFNRLTHVVEGRPAAHEGLPESNAFAAALLVLRECMHHLQFERITILAQPAP